jgi:hypothetical protein
LRRLALALRRWLWLWLYCIWSLSEHSSGSRCRLIQGSSSPLRSTPLARPSRLSRLSPVAAASTLRLVLPN